MVKRYCLQVDSETESPYGPWLKATDYDALQTKHDNLAWNLAAATAENDRNLTSLSYTRIVALEESLLSANKHWYAANRKIEALEAQDEVHWKTRRSLLAELERCRAANVYDGNAHRKVAEFEAALRRIAAYSPGLTPIPGDPIEIARTALETFAEPVKVHYSANDYEGLAVALADLLKQVNKFCEESGEGDFYTGCALAALGMSDNEVHVKTLNDLRSQANRGGVK